MALFYFVCKGCRTEKEMLGRRGSELKAPECSTCHQPMQRTTENAATGQVIERLDNGFMPRAVERHPDINRLAKERSEGKKPNSI